jgi:rod shape-determining protein MreC
MSQFVVNPGAGLLNNTANSTSDFFRGLSNSQSLVAENRRLKQLEIAAQQYLERLRFHKQENDQLRKLINLPPVPGKRQIPAQIIMYAPLENRVTINRGSNQGIKPNLPVVAAEGLVGTVQTVSANSAQVVLISSPQLRVGAVVNRQPKPFGIIRGESTNKMILQISDIKSTVEPGDVVMTSGLGELIPGGIPIGIVSMREADEEYGALQCQVFPYVRIGDIREVYVLR